MARNKQKKVLRAMQLMFLMKILCSSFFVCSNCHSDMKSLNVNHVKNYNISFLLLFNPLFSGFFDVKSPLQNVKRSVNNRIIDAGHSVQFRQTV